MKAISLLAVCNLLLTVYAAHQSRPYDASFQPSDLQPPTSSSGGEAWSKTGATTTDHKRQAGGKEPFIRIESAMRDVRATSGDKLKLRCRVASFPKLQITWLKDGKTIDPDAEERVTIASRSWGSRLLIHHVYTIDSGVYSCQATNGVSRVHDQCKVEVSFMRPPPADRDQTHTSRRLPAARCEKYAGEVCGEYFRGRDIFVDPFLDLKLQEEKIKFALSQLAAAQGVTSQCLQHAVPAFCSFIFPTCYVGADARIHAERLCREDCQLLKRDVCVTDQLIGSGNYFVEVILKEANCSALPSAAVTSCTHLDLSAPARPRPDPACYHGDGEEYRGDVSVTQQGVTCVTWPLHVALQHPDELSVHHNKCRNPRGRKMTQPWCYVDERNTQLCDVAMCDEKSAWLIPLACLGITVIVFAVVTVYACSLRQDKRVPRRHDDVTISFALPPFQCKVPTIASSHVALADKLGRGKFGKIFSVRVVNDFRFDAGRVMAADVMRSGVTSSATEEFRREMEEQCEFDHRNITSLKAIVFEQNFVAAIYESCDHLDLHAYLTSMTSSCDSITSQTNFGDFTRIVDQVAKGMEYLEKRGYVHHDLAARNVFVTADRTIKISLFPLIRHNHRSCYFRSQECEQLLPIRWMAPESLQNWQFSDKSAVWSFGVLLWEIVSYGQQPYCGYSNHEVLEMISRRQLLTCPDQCPAKVYSLMHECWADQPQDRPTFKELVARLTNWTATTTEHSHNLRTFTAGDHAPPSYSSLTLAPPRSSRDDVI